MGAGRLGHSKALLSLVTRLHQQRLIINEIGVFKLTKSAEPSETRMEKVLRRRQ